MLELLRRCEPVILERVKQLRLANLDCPAEDQLLSAVHAAIAAGEASEKHPLMQVSTCPVCKGNGIVPKGFYAQTSCEWSSFGGTEQCRSCEGKGIVVIPDPATPASESPSLRHAAEMVYIDSRNALTNGRDILTSGLCIIPQPSLDALAEALKASPESEKAEKVLEVRVVDFTEQTEDGDFYHSEVIVGDKLCAHFEDWEDADKFAESINGFVLRLVKKEEE